MLLDSQRRELGIRRKGASELIIPGVAPLAILTDGHVGKRLW